MNPGGYTNYDSAKAPNHIIPSRGGTATGVRWPIALPGLFAERGGRGAGLRVGNGLALPDRVCQSLEAGLSDPSLSRILPDLSLDLNGVELMAALGSGLATGAGRGADVGVEDCCCCATADTGVRARLMLAEDG